MILPHSIKKASLHTFGCKVNQYETQLIRENLLHEGYSISDSAEGAELVVINSCTVTSEADRQCRQLIRQISRKNPRAHIIVTGCYAIRSFDELLKIAPDVEVVIDKQGLFGRNESISEFSDHSRAFVKIQDGCDAFCSYCIVPVVRAQLWSRPETEVLKEIRFLIEKGYPEIVLSGIRLGKYQAGIVPLLRKLIEIPGAFRIRLSSLEINEVSDELIGLMAAEKEKICAHLHLPLQSGSETVLKRMRRPYTLTNFALKLSSILQLLPDAGISTDIIVGFPGETDDEFNATVAYVKESPFSRLHVFPYSKRSGTVAAEMPGQVSPSVMKSRSLVLRELDKELQKIFWRRFIGTTRMAVQESDGRYLLTDNYIRLESSVLNTSSGNSLISVHIKDRLGKPWAEKVSGIPD